MTLKELREIEEADFEETSSSSSFETEKSKEFTQSRNEENESQQIPAISPKRSQGTLESFRQKTISKKKNTSFNKGPK